MFYALAGRPGEDKKFRFELLHWRLERTNSIDFPNNSSTIKKRKFEYNYKFIGSKINFIIVNKYVEAGLTQ